MMPLAMQADEAVVVTNVIRTSEYTYDQNRRVVPVKLGVNEQNILGNLVAIDALNYTIINTTRVISTENYTRRMWASTKLILPPLKRATGVLVPSGETID